MEEETHERAAYCRADGGEAGIRRHPRRADEAKRNPPSSRRSRNPAPYENGIGASMLPTHGVLERKPAITTRRADGVSPKDHRLRPEWKIDVMGESFLIHRRRPIQPS